MNAFKKEIGQKKKKILTTGVAKLTVVYLEKKKGGGHSYWECF